ncbi:hypothetical protein MPH_03587 [Macrophomina phaseolina MS6]|uniref:Uncharacterized protein n=1 Tax=Macrophomina phaseolina (strain MS6) TaxID=1126212 RepID=K2S2G7_MACPH|nr:hypothetical protein MPH_03587 [Macrophomina phaseolina MS6]
MSVSTCSIALITCEGGNFVTGIKSRITPVGFPLHLPHSFPIDTVQLQSLITTMKVSALLSAVFLASASLAAPAPVPGDVNPNSCIDVPAGPYAGYCPSPYKYSFIKYCATRDRGDENCPTQSAEAKCCIV